MQKNNPDKKRNTEWEKDGQSASSGSGTGNHQAWQKPEIQILSVTETRQLSPPDDPMQS